LAPDIQYNRSFRTYGPPPHVPLLPSNVTWRSPPPGPPPKPPPEEFYEVVDTNIYSRPNSNSNMKRPPPIAVTSGSHTIPQSQSTLSSTSMEGHLPQSFSFRNLHARREGSPIRFHVTPPYSPSNEGIVVSPPNEQSPIIYSKESDEIESVDGGRVIRRKQINKTWPLPAPDDGEDEVIAVETPPAPSYSYIDRESRPPRRLSQGYFNDVHYHYSVNVHASDIQTVNTSIQTVNTSMQTVNNNTTIGGPNSGGVGVGVNTTPPKKK